MIWFSFASFLEEYNCEVISLYFVVVFFVFAMDRYSDVTANFPVKEWYILFLSVMLHCMKSVRTRSFFGLFRIQSGRGKLRTRKTPSTDSFYAVFVTMTNVLLHRIIVKHRIMRHFFKLSGDQVNDISK